MLKLFEVVKGTKLELPVLLGAFYGLRRSEALGIKWSAIDFEQNTIEVCHIVTSCDLDGKSVLVQTDTTKTKSSHRTLPLVPEFKEKLLEQKARQEEYRCVCSKCYNTEYLEYICIDEMGNLLRPNYVTDTFKRVLEKMAFVLSASTICAIAVPACRLPTEYL